MAAAVIRLIFFALIGIVGWTGGSLLGIGVGIVLDLVVLGDQPSGPGATVTSTVWGAALIGAAAGMVGAIAWAATRAGRPR